MIAILFCLYFFEFDFYLFHKINDLVIFFKNSELFSFLKNLDLFKQLTFPKKNFNFTDIFFFNDFICFFFFFTIIIFFFFFLFIFYFYVSPILLLFKFIFFSVFCFDFFSDFFLAKLNNFWTLFRKNHKYYNPLPYYQPFQWNLPLYLPYFPLFYKMPLNESAIKTNQDMLDPLANFIMEEEEEAGLFSTVKSQEFAKAYSLYKATGIKTKGLVLPIIREVFEESDLEEAVLIFLDTFDDLLHDELIDEQDKYIDISSSTFSDFFKNYDPFFYELYAFYSLFFYYRHNKKSFKMFRFPSKLHFYKLLKKNGIFSSKKTRVDFQRMCIESFFFFTISKLSFSPIFSESFIHPFFLNLRRTQSNIEDIEMFDMMCRQLNKTPDIYKFSTSFLQKFHFLNLLQNHFFINSKTNLLLSNSQVLPSSYSSFDPRFNFYNDLVKEPLINLFRVEPLGVIPLFWFYTYIVCFIIFIVFTILSLLLFLFILFFLYNLTLIIFVILPKCIYYIAFKKLVLSVIYSFFFKIYTFFYYYIWYVCSFIYYKFLFHLIHLLKVIYTLVFI